ncbi:MAG TPA: transglutaminase domain-containing protein [Mucilaginibacter sp.]|jgi:hypothetical protein|nr:transglutaminase domain-containing protein [Mucilaginibacter sp.]
MKKNLILCLIIFAAVAAKAQPSKEIPDFNKWTNTLDSNRHEASKLKNYPKCIEIINGWVDHYTQLSPEMQKKFMGWKAGMYYNLACYYALTGEKPKALDAFKTSVQSGYNDYTSTLSDSDLNSLHEEPAFKDELEKMREKSDYPYVLKNSGPYNAGATGLPAFTYQDATVPALVAFKQKYKLDSVAGNGDEISKFKNLLFWAHNAVRHDGNSNNPAKVNGDSLITVCKAQNRGVNCRMMATILRDAYQAEGFKARIVTCMPKDTADFDCHVIDVVWSDKLNKWVWMDPTFNAYLRDENGNYLNIEEVRARLISGSPVVLNDDANWNNRQKETKEAYFNYMSKNLYWLKCSIKSEWDIETGKTGKPKIDYINLYPGGFNTIHQARVEGHTAVYYAINNPDYFWQKPQ